MERLCTNCIYNSLQGKVIKLNEKDTIFFEGDELRYAFVIIKGLVKVSKINIDGEEKIFDIFGPNDFLALVSMLKEDKDYIATATCLNDVEVKLLRRVDVLKAYKSNTKFKDMCLTCAMNRTNLFQSKLFTLGNSNLEERILKVLEFLSQKFGHLENEVYTLNLPVSKTVLANIVGIRRETLSRKLTQMQTEGLISVNKNLYQFNRM